MIDFTKEAAVALRHVLGTSCHPVPVWFCKTARNWKAILITDDPEDNAIYEVTHNAETGETYVDRYEHVSKVTL